MSHYLTEIEKEQLISRRRDFHSHPEMGYQENRTSEKVIKHLSHCGIPITTNIAETGVVGFLQGGSPGKTLMIRADMDCLPIQETNEVPYRSQNEGRMHACGHDGHTAVLMTVAEKLFAIRNRLHGNIKFVFQPAEEGGNGAERMVKEGVLTNPSVDAALGLHVFNSLPVGKVGLNPGALMAGVHSFEITITGKGGHGAAPHQTVDVVVAAAQVINALQTIVSRKVDPLETAVVTIGSVHSGDAFNVISDKAVMKGTSRYFNPEIGEALPHWIERIVQGTTQSLGANYEMKYEKLTPPAINNPVMAALIRDISSEIVGPENVMMDTRTMGGEDMSFFLNEVPGCFFFVGSANEKKGLHYPHHSSRFDFDEEALEIGAEIMCKAAAKFLG